MNERFPPAIAPSEAPSLYVSCAVLERRAKRLTGGLLLITAVQTLHRLNFQQTV